MQKRKIALLVMSIIFISLQCSWSVSDSANIAEKDPTYQISTYEMFGYSIRHDDDIVKEYSSDANFSIIHYNEYEFNISINSSLGKFYFQEIEVYGEILAETNYMQKKKYSFRKYEESFFMEIQYYENFIWMHMSFDGDEGGLIKFDSILDDLKVDLTGIHLNTIYLNSDPILEKQKERLTYSKEEFKDILLERQKNSIITTQNCKITSSSSDSQYETEENFVPKSATVTNYALLHETCIPAGFSDFDDIQDTLEGHPSVDECIRSFSPTESDILSEIQYYCKNPILSSNRDLVAYEYVGHGSGTEWEVYTAEWTNEILGEYDIEWNGQITPDEISDLWGVLYDVEACIVLVFCCQGLSDFEMSSAWITDGEAESFCGSDIDLIQGTEDECSVAFWDKMCDTSTYYNGAMHATMDLCDEYYLYTFNTNWYVQGDTWGKL
ncbi:hypothetical protein [Candidatus Lokiarchaeum ossiferum]|uniref:hypothetical protein n=1 Tax=Candidatus Lokiarchaeum ossiferum TaxID=2951803 RepID=UPI00352E6CAB